MAKPEHSDKPPDVAELAPQYPRRRPRRKTVATLGIIALGGVLAVGLQGTTATSNASGTSISTSDDNQVEEHAEDLVREGRRTFRFDTFGDEDFWGGTLHLNDAIAGSANGGEGPGVSPKTALAVGLKVDVGEPAEETVGGYVAARLGREVVAGDHVQLADLLIEVVEAERFRVRWVIVQTQAPAVEEVEEDETRASV